MLGWILPFVVLGTLAALPALAERRRHGPAEFHEQAPGRFAKLSQGVTHYQWLGAARGPVVVCIHGLATPSPVWYAIAVGLGAMGFRVLIYDLYGRGFSDAPLGAQTPEFFNTQLHDLLEHQDLADEVTLLGFSMGGSIAASFAAAHPHRVRRVILLASAGMVLRNDRLTEICIKVPVLGDWLFHMAAQRRHRQSLRRNLGKTFDIRGITELQLAEYESRGFIRSMLSSLRNILSLQMEEQHRLIGREGIPVVGIWGEKDSVIPLRSLGILAQWNRTARQEVIPEAGHDLPYTHSEQVMRLLQDILREDTA